MPQPTPCPRCSSPIAEGSRFCASCGQPLADSLASPTRSLSPGAAPAARRASAPGSAPREARFLPGAVLAGRYRIMGLLGRGGMGEVYRADDLKLGQPVALKFLPPEFEKDADRLQRLLAEVRTARQISHANVCRIYDAGEAEGCQFLSMEYVDGEDLASLLRRIGRLPMDKAIQIARQLCAGLAASHEIGVLHRDLKPANIMIDGRGRARITDFGLAGLAREIEGAEILSGTPAYMAPEQLAGREVSVRSDLYSLGLVLYELFTGRPAYAAGTLEERRRLQTSATPSSPSSLVEGFDPAVERVILRCLEPEPARRPSSALAVAAALPGGDPIAAALAAGETPSPEMVAGAEDAGAAPPALSWGALVLFAAGLAACVALSPRATLVGASRLDKPPEVLKERAREILAMAGAGGSPADSLYTFATDQAYLADVQRRVDAGESGHAILQDSPPGGITFVYRQSPAPMAPVNGATLLSWAEDPPDVTPGMARVVLDPDGRLMTLLVVPGERLGASSADAAPDWQPLLRATGVDPNALAPAEPSLAPPVFADRRAAWTASWAGRPEIPLRIEAASAANRPVWLKVAGPWARPADGPAPPGSSWIQAGQIVGTIGFVVVVVTAGLVALRNVRHGRGDRRGALRFALFLGAIRMSMYLGAHHVASTAERDIFIGHLSYAMTRVGLAYIFYLAVEPYARRLWPRMLVGWVRALDGRFRDPLVGRDLLVGCAAGALGSLIERLAAVAPPWLGGASAVPGVGPWSLMALQGPLEAFVAIVATYTYGLLDIMFPVTLLLIFRVLLRRTAPALVVLTLMAMVMSYPGTGSVPAYLAAFGIVMAILWIVLFRFGLLAFTMTSITLALIDQMPLTPGPAGWFAGPMLLALAVIAAPAVWGFRASRAGRPLFRDEILEPAVRR